MPDRRRALDKFEEYKFFAESTEKLAERRQAATQVYLTVNTVIFAIFGFLLKDAGVRGRELLLISLPLLAIGIVACLTWFQTLAQYRALIAWRYEQLMEMERSADLSGGHQFYNKEWEDFYRPRQERRAISFTRLELALPCLFIALYVLYGLGLLLASVLSRPQG
ncbi:MAG TPA: hypothetical protein VER55_16395 [Ardenticatenaceae bacterium]|nr:hypothetical protein [Ardenticatenaceae bacterium]